MRISIGRVGRAHGLEGAFVVEAASEDPRRFELGARLYVGGEPARVVESKRAGGRPVIRLDRDAPRGAELEIDRSELGEPEPDHYYVADLIGLAVERDDGRPLGRVRAVEDGVANAVLELDSGLLLPLVDACVREVDFEAQRIVVAPGFDEAD